MCVHVLVSTVVPSPENKNVKPPIVFIFLIFFTKLRFNLKKCVLIALLQQYTLQWGKKQEE